MAAAALGQYFKIDGLDIRDAIENYRPGNMRSQLIQSGRNCIILDAYNANPSSMHAALQNFSSMKGQEKVVILGEMRELGNRTHDAHKEIAEMALQGNFSQTFFIGAPFKEFIPQSDNNHWFCDTENLINHLKANELKNFLIFVKGSRGNKLERIVEYL